MRTADLIGPALDWAVAKCEGYVPITHSRLANVMVEREDLRGIMSPIHINSLKYSTNWSQGGPIIERERIVIDTEHGDPWRARFGRARITFDGRAHHYHHQDGPTPLIAAMRCFVASRLGDDVEIPEELR